MPLQRGPIRENVFFEWNGAAVSRRVSEGVRLALEFLGADLIETAQRLVHHPGDSQGYATGKLQADISVTVPNRQGNLFTIIFGAFNTPYAFWQEILPEPTGRAYIRPAVDQNFGKLTDYLAQFLKDDGGFSAERAPGGFNQPRRKTRGVDY